MVFFKEKVFVNAYANKGFVGTHGIKFWTTNTMNVGLTQALLAYLKLIFCVVCPACSLSSRSCIWREGRWLWLTSCVVQGLQIKTQASNYASILRWVVGWRLHSLCTWSTYLHLGNSLGLFVILYLGRGEVSIIYSCAHSSMGFASTCATFFLGLQIKTRAPNYVPILRLVVGWRMQFYAPEE